MNTTEERLSLREAADALGISEVTARRWVKSGKLKAFQPGRKYLIPARAVEELLEGAEAPKLLLPFDVLEVNREVIQKENPKTGRELRDALDAEYVQRLDDWSLEDLLEAEDLLLAEYKDLLSAIPEPGSKRIEDPERYHRWTRIADELRAVTVARVAKGIPKRADLSAEQKSPSERS